MAPRPRVEELDGSLETTVKSRGGFPGSNGAMRLLIQLKRGSDNSSLQSKLDRRHFLRGPFGLFTMPCGVPAVVAVISLLLLGLLASSHSMQDFLESQGQVRNATTQGVKDHQKNRMRSSFGLVSTPLNGASSRNSALLEKLEGTNEQPVRDEMRPFRLEGESRGKDEMDGSSGRFEDDEVDMSGKAAATGSKLDGSDRPDPGSVDAISDILEAENGSWDNFTQKGDFGRMRDALIAVDGKLRVQNVSHGKERATKLTAFKRALSAIVGIKSSSDEDDFGVKCDTPAIVSVDPPDAQILRVYMYDLPLDFNWEMLSAKGRPTMGVFGPGLFETDSFPSHSDRRWKWGGCPGNHSAQVPVYAGNPSAQQHSVAYYMVLSLLQGLPSIRRVANPEEAQLFFVPYFSSISYNKYLRKEDSRDVLLQEQLVAWLEKQEPWQRSKGRDHVIVAHHPNAMEHCMSKLQNAVFVVSDFSRPRSKGSYYEKDVVAPYKAFVSPFWKDSSNSTTSWNARPTLLFFQGGFKRKRGGFIREKLKEVLNGKEGVTLVESRPSQSSIQGAALGFQQSKFCLMPAGDTPSSCRLFDTILSHCVPVVVSQALELPYEDILDYSSFAIFVPTYKALTPGYLLNVLRNITREQWEVMHQKLLKVKHFFQYEHPAVAGGAEEMIWQAVARKLKKNKPADYREKRLQLQEREKDPSSNYL